MALALFRNFPLPAPDLTEQHDTLFFEPEKALDLLPSESRAEVDSWLAGSVDRDSDLKYLAVRGYLADVYNEPAVSADRVEVLKSAYARQFLGVPAGAELDDNAFFESVKGQREFERDRRSLFQGVQEAAAELAFTGDTANAAARRKQFFEQAAGMPGYQADDVPGYWNAWSEASERATAVRERLQPYATAVLNEMRGSGEEIRGLSGAAQLLADLPDEDVAGIYELVRRQIQPGEQPGIVEGSIKGAARGTNTMLRNVGQYLGRVGDSITGETGGERWRKIETDLNALFQGKFAPLTGSGVFSRMAFGASQSLVPSLTVAAGLPGMALSFASYQEESYQQFRANGFSDAQAATYGTLAGSAKMALDRVQWNMLAKVPGVAQTNAALSKASNPASYVVRGVARGSSEVVKQAGIEIVQDVGVDAALQQVAAWLHEGIESPDWKQKSWEALEAGPDILFTMIPLVLLGTGRAGLHDVAGAQALASNGALLRAAGFNAQQVEAIRTAEKPVAALRELWGQRNPSADAPAGESVGNVAVQAYETARKESAAQVERAVEFIRKADGVREVRRAVDGWQVVKADGTVESVESADAAFMLVGKIQRAEYVEEARAIMAVADQMASQGVESRFAPETLEVEGGKIARKNAVTMQGDIIEFDAASMRNLNEEIAMMAPAQSHFINGSTWVAEDGQQIVKINLTGEALITQTHEFAESRFKTLIQTGEGQNGMILAARALSASGILEGGNAEMQAMADRVRRIAAIGQRGAKIPTDAEMRETMVELAVADVLGRLKNGSRIGAGVVTETVDRALQDAAAADRGAWGWTKSFLRAVRGYLRGVFSVASRINRARKEGKLKDGDDFTAFVDKLLGLDAQKRHNAEVLATVDGGRIEGETFSLASPEMLARIEAVEGDETTAGDIGLDESFHASRDRVLQVDLTAARDTRQGRGKAGFYTAPTEDETEQYQRAGSEFVHRFEIPSNARIRIVRNNIERLTPDQVRAWRDAGYFAAVGKAIIGKKVEVVLLDSAAIAEATAGQGAESRAAVVEEGEGFKRTQLPDGATLEGPATFSIRAFHGTPHKVDRFSLDKIGTGEGAQAYGWGLYFAESRKVAENYRDNLGPGRGAGIEDAAQRILSAVNGDVEKALLTVEARRKSANMPDSDAYFDAVESVIRTRSGLANLYTVELLPDVEDFLDWDKPLSEQSEKVKAALSQITELPEIYSNTSSIIAQPTVFDGEQLYRSLANEDGGPNKATASLASLGIPGIRYLDGNSRDGGSGTYNYVIFDDKLVRILEENGRPVEQGETFSLAGITPQQDAADPVTRDEAGNVIPLSQRFNPERDEITFSLGSVNALEEVAERIERIGGGAKAKLEAYADMARTLNGMARAARANEETEAILRAGEIERERKALQRKLEDNYLLELYQGPLGETLTAEESDAIRENDFLVRLLGPERDAVSGKKLRGLRGRFSKRTRAGEFNGAEELPSWLFRGGENPGNVSDDLGFDKPSEMWEEIGRQLDSNARLRARNEKAREAVAEAKARARNEARQWANQERAKLTQSDARDERRALIALDAMLLHLPAEVRAKVGGFTRLDDIARGPRANDARRKFFLNQVERIDAAMEDYLRKDFIRAIRETIDRGRARKVAGEKDRGKLGVNAHIWLETADAYMVMTPSRVEEREKYIDAKLGGEEISAEDVKELNRLWDLGTGEDAARLALEQERGILELFGGILHRGDGGGYLRDSGELEAALQAAKDTVEKGRRAFDEQLRARRDRRAGLQSGLIVESGAGGRDPKSAMQEREESMRGFGGSVVKFLRKGFSFESFVGDLFGRGGYTHRFAEDSSREASLVESALFQNSQRELSAFMRSLWPRSGLAARLRNMEALSTPKDILKAPKGFPKYSEMQVVHFTMLWADPDSKQWLRKHGLGDGVPENEGSAPGPDIQSVFEAALSPEAKKIRAWLQSRYDAQYDTLNDVFRRMHGVNMPRVKNYVPRMVMHGQDTAVFDPLGSGGMSARGVFAGFTKRRRQNISSAPVPADALAAYMQNQRVVTHFVAWAETAADLRAVFSNPESAPYIQAAGGKQAALDLNQWITDLESGGVKEVQTSALLSRFLRANSDSALVGKLGVLAKQFPAMYGAAVEIGWRDYLTSFGRVIRGTAARPVSGAVESRIMQARAFQRPAEIGQAASGTGASPWTARLRRVGIDLNYLDLGLDWLRNRIGATDAWFTARGAAIAYDSHFRDAKAMKMGDAEAHAYAERETERTVSRIAQPESLVNKSLGENHSGTYGRILYQFQSANRQALYMTVAAFRDGGLKSGDAWRKAVTHWVLTGIVTQTIGNLVRDFMTDADDDEVWELGDYVRAILMGPIVGAQWMVGTLIDAAASATFGGYEPRVASPVQPASEAIRAIKALFKEGEDFDWRDTEKLSRGMGLLLGGRWSALGISANFGKQISGLWENLTGEDEDGAESR